MAAANTDKFKKAKRRFSTTIAAGGFDQAATTLPLTTTTGLDTDTAVTLVIDPGGAAEEVITGVVSGSNVINCVRGKEGTTDQDHSAGDAVSMYFTETHWDDLIDGILAEHKQDGTHSDITADSLTTTGDVTEKGSTLTTQRDELFQDFVASGLVWTGDAYGSTLVASMTSGVVYINGRRLSVGAVTSRAFTASKDTYVDILDNADGTATVVYTEANNNAASPALAANSLRIAIVVTGASNIANVGSINQGQPGKLLPVASGNYYAVCDSLGNRICSRNPNGGLLGMRRIYTDDTTGGTAEADIVGLDILPLIADGVSTYRIWAHCNVYNTTAAAYHLIRIKEGATVLQLGNGSTAGANAVQLVTAFVDVTPSAGTHTYKLSQQASGGNKRIAATSDAPAFISVERV